MGNLKHESSAKKFSKSSRLESMAMGNRSQRISHRKGCSDEHRNISLAFQINYHITYPWRPMADIEAEYEDVGADALDEHGAAFHA
jgi:hypothetical protein